MLKNKVSILLFVLISMSLKSHGQESLRNDYSYFLNLFHSSSAKVKKESLQFIEQNWKESFEIYAVETLYFMKDSKSFADLFLVLQEKTNKSYGFNFNAWFEYIWSKEPNYSDEYFSFKAAIHAAKDRRFTTYFLGRERQSDIRLDEVRWGGVIQDGIPPLRNPKMIPVEKAAYLDDDHIVFGISINGDTRAYPKRILAWHEMFTDVVGNIPVAGVYCTLCGTVILYKSEKDGVNYQLGTSGFLYRSNKLMYDEKTQSLWNTLWGKPVIGPLVGKGIELEYLSVVTTTWGEWKARHPETTVLSLQTGHRRDYGEGIAYQDYFATDKLMFSVPEKDRRLKNKQEILAIRLPSETDENIAISSKFLRKNPIYPGQINEKAFTVFTDKSGAHRVYLTENIHFVGYDGGKTTTDSTGASWVLFEDHLKASSDQTRLELLPTHNAFWFGYRAAFPDVRLIKK
ncbi:MAG: DUF3179 domain-containing protein [Bacteroidota bacterium]